MIKSIALIMLFAFVTFGGCAARIEQNFPDETTTETQQEEPPAVILEGRVVLPED